MTLYITKLYFVPIGKYVLGRVDKLQGIALSRFMRLLWLDEPGPNRNHERQRGGAGYGYQCSVRGHHIGSHGRGPVPLAAAVAAARGPYCDCGVNRSDRAQAFTARVSRSAICRSLSSR
jgi:hypothetical protein